MAILIEYPFLAAVIGAFLLGLGRRTRRRTALLIGLVAAGASLLLQDAAKPRSMLATDWTPAGLCRA
jgi:hypothetical protein